MHAPTERRGYSAEWMGADEDKNIRVIRVIRG
jgi:hypothetical protein